MHFFHLKHTKDEYPQYLHLLLMLGWNFLFSEYTLSYSLCCRNIILLILNNLSWFYHDSFLILQKNVFSW